MQKNSEKRAFIKDAIMALVFAFLTLAAFFLDIYPVEQNRDGTKEKARVVSVDNANIFSVGLLKQGDQKLEVEILTGAHKGEIFKAGNVLRANMELDKIFAPGDTILAAIPSNANPSTDTINAQDHYRAGWTLFLCGLFALLLVAFAGMTGFKAVLSVAFCCAVVWKIMVPMCLRGADPIPVCLTCVCILSAAIIFLVAGINRKGATAFAGTVLGVLASCIMAWYFTDIFKINGAVMPYSQALLYSGFEDISISDIYIGAIFLSSSGAVMDLSMDIAAGMDEVSKHSPQIPRKALVKSGISIGRSVVGTMATTLLLAYSGGYLTLMMMFAAQGIPPSDFINNPYVASEAVKTIIGSFGLVLVAPFTAIAGGIILRPPRGNAQLYCESQPENRR